MNETDTLTQISGMINKAGNALFNRVENGVESRGLAVYTAHVFIPHCDDADNCSLPPEEFNRE